MGRGLPCPWALLPVMLNIEGDLGLPFLPGTASSLTPPPYTASSGIFHPLRVQLHFLASSALLFRGDCRTFVNECRQAGLRLAEVRAVHRLPCLGAVVSDVMAT